MQYLLPVFLLAATAVLGTYQQSTCNATAPEMHRFLYLRPQAFTGSTNVTVTSRNECSKTCAENVDCAYAYYFVFVCVQQKWETATMDRYKPGEVLVKIFRDQSICNTSFPQLMSTSQKFKNPSKNNNFNYQISASTVIFNNGV